MAFNLDLTTPELTVVSEAPLIKWCCIRKSFDRLIITIFTKEAPTSVGSMNDVYFGRRPLQSCIIISMSTSLRSTGNNVQEMEVMYVILTMVTVYQRYVGELSFNLVVYWKLIKMVIVLYLRCAFAKIFWCLFGLPDKTDG